jgi:hypothetical protein
MQEREENKISMLPFLDSKPKWNCRQVPTFRRNVLPPSSALKIEAICSSETLVSTYKSIWHFYPEDQHRHLHRRESLKSDKGKYFFDMVYKEIQVKACVVFISVTDTHVCVQ